MLDPFSRVSCAPKRPQDAPIPIRVDLEQSIDGETTTGDIPLQAFDVVYVPKSAIANVNLFVNQYIKGVPMFKGWGIDVGRAIFPKD